MISTIIPLYDNRSDVTLTTYILEDSPEMLKGKARPAILICPGGAYLNCSDREGEPIAMKFAAMGYHAFVLRYSTYLEGKPGFPDLSKPLEAKSHCQYPNPMLEIGMAMLLLHEHADEWHIDTDRIGLCGFSAGAHNCAMYATHYHRSIVTDYFQTDIDLLRPALCILGYTLSDYVYMDENTMNDPMARGMFDASNTAYLGSASATNDLLSEVSPARNVTDATPPMFLWATAADNLVPVQHTILMSQALANAKIPFEMHIFETGDHGLATATQASASSWSETNAEAAKWIDLCDTWLMKRFRFDLPQMNDWQMMMSKK